LADLSLPLSEVEALEECLLKIFLEVKLLNDVESRFHNDWFGILDMGGLFFWASCKGVLMGAMKWFWIKLMIF